MLDFFVIFLGVYFFMIETQRPQQRLIFRPTSSELSKNILLQFFPLFTESSPEEWGIELGRPTIHSVLKRYVEIGIFKALPDQILSLPEYGVILGGSGKRENWHPERACELFRKLGKYVKNFQDFTLEIILSDSFLKVLEEHVQKKEQHKEHASLCFKGEARQKREKKSHKKESTQCAQNSEEDLALDYHPDFIADIDAENFIIQIVSCMNIGAEGMGLCKKESHADKKSFFGVISAPSLPSPVIERGLQRGKEVSEMLQGARYLAALPGNHMNPEEYEKYACRLGKEFELKVRVFDCSALEKMGCGGIVAVGRGSTIPPRMISLEYHPNAPQTSRPLVLVGKGVTFDTGGISLKPPGEMHEMKYDMCGSALALHSVALAATRKLSVPVVALLCLAENMPDGEAIKPGDVYTAYDGTSVEIQNTDAEGRLLLGDTLAYAADNYDPLCMLDFATLTGACVVALGHDATAVMTSSEDLYSRIERASLRSLDRVWRMPHWSVYGRGLKSEIADQRNIAGRDAGTLSAMRFLARFVPHEIPWAHFDIAGTAWRAKAAGSQGSGPTAWGIRLLSNFMDDLEDNTR